MSNPNISLSSQELQRDFFDCPNCWGYQEYKDGARTQLADADETRFAGYVHLRTHARQTESERKE